MNESTPTGRTDSPEEFEFNPEQDAVIADLANSLRWVAAPLVFLGILYALAAIGAFARVFSQPEIWVHVLFLGLAAALILALGRWTTQSADSFQRVVSTSGQDIPNLMSALDNLRKTYVVLSTFVKVYVALVLIGLIVLAITLVMSLVKS
jgi:hypothetical protein